MHIRFFTTVAFLTIALSSFAQEYTGAEKHLWRPISPVPGSEVANGSEGVYIRVAFNKDYSIVPSSVRIFVDNHMIEGNVKVFPGNVFSAVYTRPLLPGKHIASAEVISTTGFVYEPFEWEFYVKSPVRDSADIHRLKDTIKLAGNIMVENRQTFLSGPGQNLRQEPPHTTQASIDLRGQNSKMAFGVRGFITSDEQLYAKNVQSRNYLQGTFGYKGVQLTLGDMNPVYDRNVLTGMRVKGAELRFKYKKIELKLLKGLLSRAVEGQLLRLGSNELAPPNVQSDSTYMVPGTYRRTISAARLQFGTISEGSYLGFTVMHAKDVPSSIKYGVAPKDNFVVGVDQTITGYDQKVKFSYGVAMSGYSNDISRGPITKPELDSILGDPNNPYDPVKYKGILIINESTIVPSNRSINAYVNTTFKLSKNHQVFAEYRKYGTSYVSFGNPFNRADQKTWEVQERFNFFRRAISGYLRYQYATNNLSNTSFTTLITNSYSGQMSINPGKKWPQLTLSGLQQERRNLATGKEVSIYFLNNDVISSYTASLSYTLRTGELKNNISLNTVQSQRKDKTNPMNDNTTQIYSAGLQQAFSFPLTLNYQFSTSKLLLKTGSYGSLTTSYSIGGQYKIKKLKWDIGAGYYANQMGATPFSASSSRPLMKVFSTYGGFKGKELKNLSLYLEAATAPYTDNANANNNYSETYVYIRANYLIN